MSDQIDAMRRDFASQQMQLMAQARHMRRSNQRGSNAAGTHGRACCCEREPDAATVRDSTSHRRQKP
eukprot:2839838-Prymnesium_polylepis.1